MAERRDPRAVLTAAQQALGGGRPGQALDLLRPFEAAPALARLPAPMQAAVHAFRGTARLQLGDPPAAAAAFSEAMRIDRKDAGLACSLGAALQQAGRAEDALAAFVEAERRAPGLAQAAYGRGVVLHGLGRFPEAANALAEAIRRDPNHLPAHENRAIALAAAGRDAEADAAWREGLATQPKGSPGYRRLAAGLARHLAANGRAEAALPWFAAARGGGPPMVEGLAGSEAAALLDAGRPADAAALLAAPAQAPSADAELLSLLGAALLADGRPEQALPVLQRAIGLDPGHRGAQLHAGHARQALGDLAAAEAHHRAALRDDPAWPPAVIGLATVLQEAGDDDAATEMFDRAAAAAPEQAQLRWNRALHDLLCGRYAAGWDGYVSRWQVPDFPTPAQETGLPAWNGEDPAGRHLFVWPEQGPGDEIMFASCLPDLLAAGAEVTLQTGPRLAPLFARSFPGLRVTTAANPPPSATAALPIGDLPRHYRQREADFPARPAFLAADRQAVADWRARWRDASGAGGTVVGLSWRGGVTPGERRRRGATLEDWSPVLRLPGLVWVNMQYGADAAARFAAAAEIYGMTVVDGPDPAGDLDALAAAVAATDAVASMANTLVHLAGGLGRPCLAVVPAAPSWRWQRARLDSPWYPTARLVRQGQDEAWPQVMSRAADILSGLLRDGRTAAEEPDDER